ncbi:PTS-dependent dihydroxyacetone kinase phosphotransferase subunit DhaM [Streptomyces sp. JJ38]|uniref:PTS-dependent dihydroxyacetone kinase phosphotransferase subunit DhaM n=1 Tax=Streptomyces sp. JJ38 TaxID=2738128 RepID=UPI001C5A3C71|nr:PTS fructose transporter subunit IIA [Streptomyces sp. JJ38]MBW1596266.1 PTS fructose transporter subunit IIA [Streptomyces sp. JJ38]
MTDQPLVGVVLVSHSREVAESVARLATRLAAGGATTSVVAAGGTPDGGLGTSAELITACAARADRGAGVVLLADLGSAVLTVRTLLAEEELPTGARLADAPFVEGAVAAVVAASAGADPAAVVAAAEEAYTYRKL